MSAFGFDFGAVPRSGGVVFRVWAPCRERVEVRVVGPGSAAPVPLARDPGGVFEGAIPGLGPGARYVYRLDGGPERPDPVSRSQPEGVHGPSEVVDPGAFPWTDAGWRGRAPARAAALRAARRHLHAPRGRSTR